MERPGFERLVAQVCSGNVGAVYCIEASRLARNGRDWHHLIDLCALAGTWGSTRMAPTIRDSSMIVCCLG
ncbi:recombinase family protein [Sinorhizobium sp. CCBAU 05631]|nr:recombinase family protein [Sinorhizobium sp. CCBAU 05631]